MAIKELQQKLTNPNLTAQERARIETRIKFEQAQAKQGTGAKTPATQQPAPQATPQVATGTGFATNVTGMLAKQQKALQNQKYNKAAKIGNNISKIVAKDPTQGFQIDQNVAKEEFNTNINANRPDQQTIGGSRKYTQNPDGTYSVIDELAPEQDALYKGQIANVGAANQQIGNAFANNQFGQSLDLSGLPAAPDMSNLDASRQRIEGEIYKRESGMIDQDFQREQKQVMDRMYQTGNPQGSPAYEKAMENLDRKYKPLYDDARSKAVATGGQEFAQSFNIGTQARGNALNETLTARNQPLSELTQLQGMGGGATVAPNFFNFQPIQYDAASYLPYQTLSIEQKLKQDELNIARQKANQSGGGGSSSPAFSIGGMPTGGFTAPQKPANPVGAGFAQGVQQGATIGLTK